MHFYACVKRLFNEVAVDLAARTVDIDGKTLRCSHDRVAGELTQYSVIAWVSAMKCCIGIKSIENKSNEIPTVIELVDMLDLKGVVVTADAMHCQKQSTEKIQR